MRHASQPKDAARRVVTCAEPIYQSTVSILIGSEAELIAWLIHEGVSPSETLDGTGCTVHWTDTDGAPCFGIRLPTWRRGHPYDASLLAHEALHVARWIAHSRGLEGNEAECYYLQWLVYTATSQLAR